MTWQLGVWGHETPSSDQRPGWPWKLRALFPAGLWHSSSLTDSLYFSAGLLQVAFLCYAFRLDMHLSSSPEGSPEGGCWVLKAKGSTNRKSHLVKTTLKKKIPVSLTQLSQLFLKQWFWLESAPRDKQTRLLHTRQIRVGSEAVADYNEIISIELEAWVCLVDFFASKPRHEMVGNHRQAHQRGNQNGTWHFN